MAEDFCFMRILRLFAAKSSPRETIPSIKGITARVHLGTSNTEAFSREIKQKNIYGLTRFPVFRRDELCESTEFRHFATEISGKGRLVMTPARWNDKGPLFRNVGMVKPQSY